MEGQGGTMTERTGGIRWLYRQGMLACEAGDALAAKSILLVLAAALDFDYEEAATWLFELYEELRDHVDAGRYEQARAIFERLGHAVEPPRTVR